MEKTTYMNYLFDFYHVLLTPKQRNYMAYYYLEDYSLGEIAELFQISRQAVYDNLKRTEKMLEDYEAHLHLYDKFKTRTEIIEEMDAVASDPELKNLIRRLKELE